MTIKDENNHQDREDLTLLQYMLLSFISGMVFGLFLAILALP